MSQNSRIIVKILETFLCPVSKIYDNSTDSPPPIFSLHSSPNHFQVSGKLVNIVTPDLIGDGKDCFAVCQSFCYTNIWLDL